MATSLRFVRGMLYNHGQGSVGTGMILKLLYEFWGYCVNGTSALQTPGGFATSMNVSYTISSATNATPIVITTTSTNALVTGQQVVISGVGGNTAANGTFQITVVTNTTFQLNGTVGNGGYTGGGTVNTTPYQFPLSFTEGNTVLAVGNDGYTAAQISVNAGGSAIFTATTNSPFSGSTTSLTINGATNYQTTIAVGSNGVSLPTSTINVASTTPAATTITASSNNVSLPTATINVSSTVGFPSSGYIFVVTSEGLQQVNYTGITATTFTGCTGGIGSMTTGNVVNFTFAPSGTINVTTSNGPQLVTYTGITATTLTGCTGGTGTMSTGGAVFAPIMISTTAGNPNSYPNLGSVVVQSVTGNPNANGTWTITTPTYNVTNSFTTGTAISPPSNGLALPQATINAVTAAPVTTTTGVQTLPLAGASLNVAATATASTTILAASNGTSLPTGTINATSTTGFPTAGTINVFTTVVSATGGGSNGAVFPQSTIATVSTAGFPSTGGTIQVAVGSPTTIAVGSNGAALPQGTINVASTAGFGAGPGFIFVVTSAGTQLVAYTSTSGGTQFTGCSGGTGTMSTGGLVYPATAVTYTGTTATTFTGCTGGSGTMFTGGPIGGGPFPQAVAYTGTTATTFTGCTLGTGTMFTGNTINNTGFFTNFPTAGSCYVNTTNGPQLITYTSVTATTLAGVNGGTGNTSAGGSVFTAYSPATNYTSVASGSNGLSLPQSTINVASTVLASTTIASGSNGQALPQSIINVSSTSGFPAFGVIYVTTSTGAQLVSYTGLTGTSFTGCSNGNGTMSTGGSVIAGFPSSGFINVQTTNGFQVVNYTGLTGTSFTGCTGGTGTMSTGNSVFLGFQPTGTVNVTSSTGLQAIAYTGTTATTFTGCTGGGGTMSFGGAIISPIYVTTSLPTPLTTGQTVTIAGIVGIPFANGTFAITMVNNNNFVLNGSLSNGAYVSGGVVTDHSNFVLNGSVPNGTYAGSGTANTTNMTGKLLTIWKPNSGTAEDSLYIITSVISSNTLQINLNTGGTPDPTTLHPSFTQRSNINYRVVDAGAAAYNNGASGTAWMVMQFNPSAINLNPGQANSQIMMQTTNAGNVTMTLSPGGNWSGVNFPVTGNPQIDASNAFASQSSNFWNGGGSSGTQAQTMYGDPGMWTLHFKDTSNSDGTSYLHCEIPQRLYASSADTNPMVAMNRGGTFNGSVFAIGTSTGQNFGRGWMLKGTDNTVRAHYAVAKSLSGDASPIFGSQLTDFRLAFNTSKGFILASDILCHLPGVPNQFALGRCKIRSIKFTSTPLPLYHRFGTPGGNQYLNVQNGIAILWDNTILPTNLYFQI